MNARALMLVLLGGCATQTVDLNATRDSWYGARYEVVVTQWGEPARNTTLADGSDARTWVSEAVSGGGSWFPMLGIFGGSRGVGTGAGISLGQSGGDYTRCERTLIFRDGQVVDQSWQGQSRYCSTFRRY
jgi:hypothetical protein